MKGYKFSNSMRVAMLTVERDSRIFSNNQPHAAEHNMRHGRICYSCRTPLPIPHTPTPKLCAFCADKHIVYMHIRRCGGWQCIFTAAKIRLPRQCLIKDATALREMVKRGNGLIDEWDISGLELFMELGRGKIMLRLNDEQYAALGGAL